MLHSSAPADTDFDVVHRQFDLWREMTPADRAELADQLSIDVVTIASAGVRHDDPDVSDNEVARELVRRRYGRALADAAFDRTDPE